MLSTGYVFRVPRSGLRVPGYVFRVPAYVFHVERMPVKPSLGKESHMARQSRSGTSKPRLGRGLSSLISSSADLTSAEGQYYSTSEAPPAESPPSSHGLREAPTSALDIPIDDISPNPYQPRREFDEASLADLAQSITRQGILQPLVVSPGNAQTDEKPYILIAGERRLRAARLAGLSAVPCVVRSATPEQMLEWALVENIQRSDLNPVERAEAYRDYMDRFGLTHAQVGERLGQPRTTVVNYLRVLDLGDDVQRMLRSGNLSFGHAKVLAGLVGDPGRQLSLARRVVSGYLSVRQLEALVGQGSSAETPAERVLPARPRPAYLRDTEERLTQAVGTRVSIRPGRAKHTGRIVVEYYSLDDFDRVAGLLGLATEA